nr:DUF4262 domain-containing protein [Streptomyces sp. SID4917]
MPEGRPRNTCEDVDCPVCPPDFVAEYAARLRGVIAEHGFAVRAVRADESSAAYCCTVGLHESLGHEFVMAGLDIRAMQGVIHSVIERFAGSSRLPRWSVVSAGSSAATPMTAWTVLPQRGPWPTVF